MFTERDAFEQLASALFLKNRGIVAVLTAYFDESYSHRTDRNPNTPRVYTVAGWISTVEKWKALGKEWRKALNEAQIESFHMKEYESRIGEYADWIPTKRIKVLKRLHRIINQHALYGFSASVNMEEFDEVMTPEAKRILGKTHYAFDVRLCLRQVGIWADKNGVNDPINYVFAELDKQGGALDFLFKTCLADPEVKEWFRMNGMWTKGRMKDVLQLQPADVLAYEVNKRVVNHVAGGKIFSRRSLLNLSQYEKFQHFLYFGKPEILKWIALLESGQGHTAKLVQ